MCYNGTYDIQLHDSELAKILNQCNRSRLLMACGSLNTSSIYSVAAMSNREDVLYDCQNEDNCTHIADGNQWYFNTNSSWGFTGETDSIDRKPCDADTANPSHRLCWHTKTGYNGYRCGSTLFLYNGTDPKLWQRVVWHADPVFQP